MKSVLEVLTLAGNRVTGCDLALLSDGLKSNRVLKQLDLSDNKIDGKVRRMNLFTLASHVDF